jgi:hypothetical protein
MQVRSKLAHAALAGALVLATAVGTASATRLEVSSQSFRVVWRELKFTSFSGMFLITCPVTIEGTLHSRRIRKLSGELVGFVNRAAVAQERCVGGTSIILNGVERIPGGGTTGDTLPWHLRYDSFTAGLPRIESVRLQIVGWAWLQRIMFLGVPITCLYRSTEAEPFFEILRLNTTSGAIEELRSDESSEIPLVSGEGACPTRLHWGGTATFTVQGATTAITVRLVT